MLKEVAKATLGPISASAELSPRGRAATQPFLFAYVSKDSFVILFKLGIIG